MDNLIIIIIRVQLIYTNSNKEGNLTSRIAHFQIYPPPITLPSYDPPPSRARTSAAKSLSVIPMAHAPCCCRTRRRGRGGEGGDDDDSPPTFFYLASMAVPSTTHCGGASPPPVVSSRWQIWRPTALHLSGWPSPSPSRRIPQIE